MVELLDLIFRSTTQHSNWDCVVLAEESAHRSLTESRTDHTEVSNFLHKDKKEFSGRWIAFSAHGAGAIEYP